MTQYLFHWQRQGSSVLISSVEHLNNKNTEMNGSESIHVDANQLAEQEEANHLRTGAVLY